MPADSELIRSILKLRDAERRVDPRTRDDLADVREQLESIVGLTVTRAEAARQLGVTQAALDKWIKKGEIASVQTPRGRREVPLLEVLELVEEIEATGDRTYRPLSRVIRERRRRSEAAVDLNRLLPRTTRPRSHRSAELQSLAYHRLVAERLSEAIVDAARRRVDRWRNEARVHPTWVAAWEKLLTRPIAEIAETIAADSPKARELRQTSPFAGVLSQQERRRIVEAVEERLAS